MVVFDLVFFYKLDRTLDNDSLIHYSQGTLLSTNQKEGKLQSKGHYATTLDVITNESEVSGQLGSGH